MRLQLYLDLDQMFCIGVHWWADWCSVSYQEDHAWGGCVLLHIHHPTDLQQLAIAPCSVDYSVKYSKFTSENIKN